jgi:hypothetical protein
MLRKPSLIVQPTSGFVPFSGGGALDPSAPNLKRFTRAPIRALAPAAVRASTVRNDQGIGRAVWEPGIASSVRGVEMAALAAICGYFAFGLGKLLGLL